MFVIRMWMSTARIGAHRLCSSTARHSGVTNHTKKSSPNGNHPGHKPLKRPVFVGIWVEQGPGMHAAYAACTIDLVKFKRTTSGNRSLSAKCKLCSKQWEVECECLGTCHPTAISSSSYFVRRWFHYRLAAGRISVEVFPTR